MNPNDDFGLTVSAWLHEDAEHRVPDHLDAVLRRTSTERQRPAWSSLERWLPVSVTLPTRVAPIPRQLQLIALVAAIVLAAVLLVLASVGQRHAPSFRPTANGQIAFVDGSSIRIADADGTVGPQLTAVPDGAEELTFAPDGRHLAYRTLAQSDPSIVLANSDGSNPIVVAAGLHVALEPLAWSPDSRRIAFVVASGNVESIELVDADGTHRRSLAVNVSGTPLDPAWSPDGNWIAYFSSTNGSPAVSLIHPDGSGQRTLNTPPVDRDGMAWSPDPGRLQLTFKAVDIPQSGGSQGPGAVHAFIRVYDLATATERSVAETSIVSGTGPVWSPDGSRISWWNDGVYTASPAGPPSTSAVPTRVFPSVRGGCSEYPELAMRAVCGPVRWSPDGRWLFGPGIGGTSFVFGRSDGSGASRVITLAHPMDSSAVSGWQVAWQAVQP
jgi:Tol biopolymer transport system component